MRRSFSGSVSRRAFLRSAAGVAVAAWAGCAAPRRASSPVTLRFRDAWGTRGAAPGEFASPIGIAIDARDHLYVTDVQNARVQKLTREGEPLGTYSLRADLPAEERDGFALAAGVAVDRDGLVYATVMDRSVLLVFEPEGELVRSWGGEGTAPGRFDQPGSLALGADGRVYVADQVNRRVQVFTREGELLFAWGEHGSEPGSFDGIEPPISRFGGPHWVTLDGCGHVYTTEGALGRVQRWTTDGEHEAAWGERGEGPGQLGLLETDLSEFPFGPVGLCTDHRGRVWVSSLNHRVQLFTPDGRYLGGTGVEGEGPGEFATPHGMVVDSGGDLFVVDSGNHRVQRLAVEEA